MKIRPVRAVLFHADRRTDGWTDMTKLIVAFCNVAKAPKILPFCPHIDKLFALKCTTQLYILQYRNIDSHRLFKLKAREDLYFVVYVLIYVIIHCKYKDENFREYTILRHPDLVTTNNNVTCIAKKQTHCYAFGPYGVNHETLRVVIFINFRVGRIYVCWLVGR